MRTLKSTLAVSSIIYALLISSAAAFSTSYCKMHAPCLLKDGTYTANQNAPGNTTSLNVNNGRISTINIPDHAGVWRKVTDATLFKDKGRCEQTWVYNSNRYKAAKFTFSWIPSVQKCHYGTAIGFECPNKNQYCTPRASAIVIYSLDNKKISEMKID